MRTRDQIQQELNTKVESIDGHKELTPIARRARKAAALKPARAEIAALENAARESRSAAISKAEQTAFNSSTPGDALSTMARRQAVEMVAKIDSPADAARLLQQATETGDDSLAEEVARHSFKMSGFGMADPDWAHTLNDFAVPRPKAFAAIESLLSYRREGPLAGKFDFMLVPPAELANAADLDLDRYIAEDPSVVETGVS